MVAIPRPVFLEEFVRRSLYARLVRVDFLIDQPYRRAAFEFDGIDADDMDDARSNLFSRKVGHSRSPKSSRPPRDLRRYWAQPRS